MSSQTSRLSEAEGSQPTDGEAIPEAPATNGERSAVSPPREPLSPYPAGSLRELLVVAVPLMVSTGSHAVMVFFDRLFLARYSAEAFAAAMPAGLLNWTLMALPLGLVSYASTFVAQYHGAERPDRVKATVWQAIFVALAAGAVLLAGWPLWQRMIRLFGHSGNIVPDELAYLGVLTLLCPIRLLAAAAGAYFSGRGRTRVVMASGIAGAVTNLALNPLLIFGLAGLPAMGIRGAAWATVVSTAVELGVLVLVAVRERRPSVPTFRETFAFDRALTGRLVRYGLPQGVQYAADLGAFMLVIAIVGRIGDAALQATNLAFQMNSIAFIPLIGLGHAVSAVVGHRVGERRPDRADRSVWMAAAIGSAWMLPFCTAYVLAPDATLWPIARFADGNVEEFREEAKLLLRYIAVYSAFDIAAVVFGAAIRGAGDTRFSLWLTVLSCWLLMAVPLLVLSATGHSSLHAAWVLITLAIAAMGGGFLWRFLAGQWRSMTVMDG